MFDLDAFVAEAEGTPFEFTFGGKTYTLPPAPDVRVAAQFDAGNYGAALRLMLGAEQYEQFIGSNAHLPREAFLEVIKQHAAHQGSSVGESSASTDSSSSTVKRSRRTSSATTSDD